MAEAIFNKLADENKICGVHAESFGIATKSGIDVSDNSVIACNQLGIDIKDKKSVSVNDVNINKYEKIYCMSETHKKMLVNFFDVPQQKITVLGISDPYGGSVEIYRKCCNEIYNSVQEIIKEYEN